MKNITAAFVSALLAFGSLFTASAAGSESPVGEKESASAGTISGQGSTMQVQQEC